MQKEDEYEELKERAQRFAKIWWSSRAYAGISQEKLAMEIGVSKKTIQNWEKGVSAPNYFQGSEWFRALGVNPLPYFLGYLYPKEMDSIKAEDEDSRIEEALEIVVKDLSIENKRKLLFMLWGGNGGSQDAELDLITAFLQQPLKERIAQAAMIAQGYELTKDLGMLRSPEHIQPNMEKLHGAIEQAKQSVLDGREAYHLM